MPSRPAHDGSAGPTDFGEHGPHTLRVWSGTIVGIHGDDVFVELGPRLQGVLSRRQFDELPRLGDVREFTVLGQEGELWALALVEERLLDSWSNMELGSWVQARGTGKNPGGLELKIGPLHAFMPKSESGLPMGQDPKVLVGTTMTCEVIEIDPERQRVLVSRKRVLKGQRTGEAQREAGSLKLGQVVHGRVTRIEDFGAFVAFGRGLEGLIHVSNLSVERVGHPSEVLRKNQSVEAKVLSIRRAGKRIGLGLKQMSESPWKELERSHYPDEILVGRVTRTATFGAFVAIRQGVEGLVHDSASGLGPTRRLRDVVQPGAELTVRIVSFDVDAERLELSCVHRSGAPLRPEEALGAEQRAKLDELARKDPDAAAAPATTNLGRLLARAIAPAAAPGDAEAQAPARTAEDEPPLRAGEDADD